MVKGIFMFLFFINVQGCQSPDYIHICIVNLNRRIVKNKRNHVGFILPNFREQPFCAKRNNQFLETYNTKVFQILRIFENGTDIITQRLLIADHININVSIEK